MRAGRRLAIDVGMARIGIAVSDFHGLLASPVGNLARLSSIEETVDSWPSFAMTHEEIADVDFLEAYVGLPISLSGGATKSTKDALEFAKTFSQKTGIQVRMLDERLTTVAASASLRTVGINSKAGRGKVDAIAATLILEQALSAERSRNALAGLTIEEAEEQFG